MSVPPADFDPIMLAAHAARAMSQAHRMAYAHLAPDLTIVQTSSNFPFLLESQTGQIIGLPVTEILWEFVGAEAALHDILRGEIPLLRLEQVNRGQGEAMLYLNFQVTPLDAFQPDRGLLLLVEDETAYGRLQQTLVQDRNELRLLKRKLTSANDELRRLNRLKSLFLSMSAHDLRAPLTSIGGYASLLLEIMSDAPADTLKYLGIILSQSEQMNRIISDFLDLDKLEQGLLSLHLESCDLNQIIARVSAAMQVVADSRQIAIALALPSPPLYIWADPDKLYRIIYNLVSNAVKYTPRNGRVHIEARQSDEQITLQVSDNGHGMSEEQLDNLFQLYYRTENARKSKTKGTGLGLYIVKMLVEAHQGRITVASKPGAGSIFTVTLPRQLPDNV